jgi:hypothetical protein
MNTHFRPTFAAGTLPAAASRYSVSAWTFNSEAACAAVSVSIGTPFLLLLSGSS